MDKALAVYIAYSIAFAILIACSVLAVGLQTQTTSFIPAAVVVLASGIISIGYFATLLIWYIINRVSTGRLTSADRVMTTGAVVGTVANLLFTGFMVMTVKGGASLMWGARMIVWLLLNAVLIGVIVPLTLQQGDKVAEGIDVMPGRKNMLPLTGEGASLLKEDLLKTSGLSVSMYLGLDPKKFQSLQAVNTGVNTGTGINPELSATGTQMNTASRSLLAKIPLLLVGLNKPAYKDDKGREARVASPVIYMVLEKSRPVYFEVDFNHMESVATDPAGGLLADQSACYIVNRYTGRCRFFKNSPLIEAENNLMKYWAGGYGKRPEVASGAEDEAFIHHLAFVFSQSMMPTSAGSGKHAHTTAVTIYVNKKAQQTLYFPGQMAATSTHVLPLPSNYFVRGKGVTQQVLKDLLSESVIADIKVFPRALSSDEVSAHAGKPNQEKDFAIARKQSDKEVVIGVEVDDKQTSSNQDFEMEPGLVANEFRVPVFI